MRFWIIALVVANVLAGVVGSLASASDRAVDEPRPPEIAPERLRLLTNR